MNAYAKVSLAQWDAIAAVQENYGVPDRLLAKAVGCGATTIVERRRLGGWTQRKLPKDFATSVMLREAGETEVIPPNLFAETAGEPMLDDAALRRALERLMTAIVNETARVGLGEIDPLAVKRLEVMSNMARSFERLMELKVKLTPPGEAAGGADMTAAVLAQMDRRVDELANRRARDIVEQCCQGGDCRAVLPDAD